MNIFIYINMNKYITTIRNISKTAFNFYISNEHRYIERELELIIISLKKGYKLRNSVYFFK